MTTFKFKPYIVSIRYYAIFRLAVLYSTYSVAVADREEKRTKKTTVIKLKNRTVYE